LKQRCLKWARIAHLDIWNTSYGQKKGRESNWQFDFWPLKVENWPNFITFRQRVTYHWKALNEGYNFVYTSAPSEVCMQSYAPSKLQESQMWEFRDSHSHLGVPRQKTIWMWPSWRGAEYTIRRKVVVSFKFGLWWVLCVRIACGSS
jgi:hypothetical protein